MGTKGPDPSESIRSLSPSLCCACPGFAHFHVKSHQQQKCIIPRKSSIPWMVGMSQAARDDVHPFHSIPNALNPMALPTTPILGRMSTHSSPGGLMQFGRPFRRSAGHALLCRFSKTASILWPTFRHPLPSRAPLAIPRFACPLLLLAKSPFNPIPIASGGQGRGKRAAPKTAGGQPFSAIPSHIRAPCPPPGRMR